MTLAAKLPLYAGVMISAVLLVACEKAVNTSAETQQGESPESPESPESSELSLDAPPLGTKIQDTFARSDASVLSDDEYQSIAWEDLELPGQGLEAIVKRYQFQIDLIPEGSSAEDAVMEQMQAELDKAPVNLALNGKKIKLPGFIAPLDIDDSKGVISEFLLVPYFGACIHLPPPPLSQTILVKPKAGQGIGLERAHEPFWVAGVITGDSTQTDLAAAGYQIKEAVIEPYISGYDHLDERSDER